MVLVDKLPISLTAASPRMRTPKVLVGSLSDTFLIRLRRPTTVNPLAWDANSTVRVTLAFIVDGQEFRCVGQATGGIRTNPKGEESAEYSLSYNLPVVFRDGRAKRLGETAKTEVAAYIILERLQGTIETELVVANITERPAPFWPIHRSVAFNAATSAVESGGDGILSLTHTSTGSDLAVFAGSTNQSDNGSYNTVASITYNAVGMTGMWEQSYGSIGDRGNAAFQLAGQATGPQTVTATLNGTSFFEQLLGVISMTGVHQTTPVGTHVNSTGTTSPASVTVGSVGVDDLVVDHFSPVAGGTLTTGANQTERYSEGLGNRIRGSSQAGSDGGVMSWTFTDTDWGIGAVAFKPVAGETPVSQTAISAYGSLVAATRNRQSKYESLITVRRQL